MREASIWAGNEERYEFTAKQMQASADNDPNSQGRCLHGERVFWHVGPYGVLPGHIYSRDGAIEYRRKSGLCEFHFDVMFADEGDLPKRGWAIIQEYRAAQKDG